MKKNRKILVGVLGANLMAASAIMPVAFAQEIVTGTQTLSCPTVHNLTLDLNSSASLTDPLNFSFPSPNGIPRENADEGAEWGSSDTGRFRVDSDSVPGCGDGVELRVSMPVGFYDSSQASDPDTAGWLRSASQATTGATYNYALVSVQLNVIGGPANGDPLMFGNATGAFYSNPDPLDSTYVPPADGLLQAPSNDPNGPTLGDSVLLSSLPDGYDGYAEADYTYHIALPGLTKPGTYTAEIEWQVLSP